MRYRIDVVTKADKVDGRYVYHISFWVTHRGFEHSLLIHIPCGRLISPETLPEGIIKLCPNCGRPMDDASLSAYIGMKETNDVVAARLASLVSGLIDAHQEVELYLYRTDYSPARMENLTKFEYHKALEKRLHRQDESGLYTWERLRKDMETRDLVSLMKMFLG
jgi:hypothetical protein